MSWIDYLKGGTKSVAQEIKTRQTDEFADLISLELKSIATEAVKQAIEIREARYMKSVLEESYFLLDSMVISPKDREVAQRFNDFLNTHESVDSQFRHKFFQQIIQREYRSSRGSSVRVPTTFEPTVQLGSDSLESLTSEEGFQISLKGRRISFEVMANLSGPFKKEAASSRIGKVLAEATTLDERLQPQAFASKQANSNLRNSEIRVEIQITDSLGTKSEFVTLPVLIGKEPPIDCAQFGFKSLIANSTYVSRSQLILIDVMGQPYYYIPENASLSCIRSDGLVLEKTKLYPLRKSESIALRTGIPPDVQTTNFDQGSDAEFSTIKLHLLDPKVPAHDGTPRPKAVA